jgi:hypothetical protein
LTSRLIGILESNDHIGSLRNRSAGHNPDGSSFDNLFARHITGYHNIDYL